MGSITPPGAPADVHGTQPPLARAMAYLDNAAQRPEPYSPCRTHRARPKRYGCITVAAAQGAMTSMSPWRGEAGLLTTYDIPPVGTRASGGSMQWSPASIRPV